ncbi:MAG: hypothetical protein R3C19_07330 [Planctomycetaceae bacterium]
MFNEDTSPLEATTLDTMRDELMGFTPGDSEPNGNYGGYFGHNGSFSNRATSIPQTRWKVKDGECRAPSLCSLTMFRQP